MSSPRRQTTGSAGGASTDQPLLVQRHEQAVGHQGGGEVARVLDLELRLALLERAGDVAELVDHPVEVAGGRLAEQFAVGVDESPRAFEVPSAPTASQPTGSARSRRSEEVFGLCGLERELVGDQRGRRAGLVGLAGRAILHRGDPLGQRRVRVVRVADALLELVLAGARGRRRRSRARARTP